MGNGVEGSRDPLKLIRKAVDEFAKVFDQDDKFHVEYIHAACGLIAHELAIRTMAAKEQQARDRMV